MAYAIPVVTDATAASEPLLKEAAACFLPASDLCFKRTQGGVNNRCYYIATTDAVDAYVLRIYNNGFNTPRVHYEHAVLAALADTKLSFSVPKPVKTLADPTSTIAILSTGDAACMFHVIPGGGAGLGAARSIGAATAELLEAMKDIRIDLPLPNPLYRNIYDAHHKMNKELFFSTISCPECVAPGVKESTDYLVQQLLRCEDLVAHLPSLPVQQIHADLHIDNILAEGDSVSGVLDFEFSAYDWRAMEMAVGLSKYVGMSGIDIEAAVCAWVEGYASAGGRLTADEIRLMPDFIILRILSNVVYFAGRAAAGEDLIDALTTREGTYAARCKWLEAHRQWLTDTLTSKVLTT
jgi:homoserine kinase type II